MFIYLLETSSFIIEKFSKLPLRFEVQLSKVVYSVRLTSPGFLQTIRLCLLSALVMPSLVSALKVSSPGRDSTEDLSVIPGSTLQTVANEEGLEIDVSDLKTSLLTLASQPMIELVCTFFKKIYITIHEPQK